MVNLIKLSPKNKILNDTNYLNILVRKQQFLQELKIMKINVEPIKYLNIVKTVLINI